MKSEWVYNGWHLLNIIHIWIVVNYIWWFTDQRPNIIIYIISIIYTIIV